MFRIVERRHQALNASIEREVTMNDFTALRGYSLLTSVALSALTLAVTALF